MADIGFQVWQCAFICVFLISYFETQIRQIVPNWPNLRFDGGGFTPIIKLMESSVGVKERDILLFP